MYIEGLDRASFAGVGLLANMNEPVQQYFDQCCDSL